MGYTLIIGERESDGAQEITLPQAPTFTGDDPTGRSNKRMMSYSTFADFYTKTGLVAILYLPVRQRHPGYLEITEAMVSQIEEALRTYEAQHRPPAGFGPLYDGNRARLRWLHWWMAWALRNCRQPVLANR